MKVSSPESLSALLSLVPLTSKFHFEVQSDFSSTVDKFQQYVASISEINPGSSNVLTIKENERSHDYVTRMVRKNLGSPDVIFEMKQTCGSNQIVFHFHYLPAGQFRVRVCVAR